jgi:hypothetical protein
MVCSEWPMQESMFNTDVWRSPQCALYQSLASSISAARSLRLCMCVRDPSQEAYHSLRSSALEFWFPA